MCGPFPPGVCLWARREYERRFPRLIPAMNWSLQYAALRKRNGSWNPVSSSSISVSRELLSAQRLGIGKEQLYRLVIRIDRNALLLPMRAHIVVLQSHGGKSITSDPCRSNEDVVRGP